MKTGLFVAAGITAVLAAFEVAVNVVDLMPLAFALFFFGMAAKH